MTAVAGWRAGDPLAAAGLAVSRSAYVATAVVGLGSVGVAVCLAHPGAR